MQYSLRHQVNRRVQIPLKVRLITLFRFLKKCRQNIFQVFKKFYNFWQDTMNFNRQRNTEPARHNFRWQEISWCLLAKLISQRRWNSCTHTPWLFSTSVILSNKWKCQGRMLFCQLDQWHRPKPWVMADLTHLQFWWLHLGNTFQQIYLCEEKTLNHLVANVFKTKFYWSWAKVDE